ncbi:hypothetical protein [Aurantiacibacter odishensis]|uniref:hypothetical protein n=1 Tax=Aurantiacibacter odishensis TaxID=1155476 RepID=UPI0013C41A26|nr:hypothetical protein [Aurantiacibacter odishensis]
MKFTIALPVIALCIGTPALADNHDAEEKPQAEVIERDEDGRATRIRVDGYEVEVCREGQQDDCINPREAGLDFGGVPIDYWPGRPASEIEGDLPIEAPAQESEDAEG